MKSRVTSLVAGGAGFLGSHLCERLLNDGHHVVCIDNLVSGRLRNISALMGNPHFTFINADILDSFPLPPVIDRIYHLASPASPPVYQRYPIETLRVNSEGTRKLLELAERTGARFLFASTSEIYGDPLIAPQREDYRGNVSCNGPRAMYDEAKRYGEAITQSYIETRGVDARIIRIFNTYGPRLDPNDGRVVSNFVAQALRGESITVYGDGNQTRSFQYIDDLIEGMVRLMESTCREPVNIGNPIEFTVLELAQLVLEMIPGRSTLVWHPLPGDDPRQRRPDISRAKDVLNWEPKVALRQGLASTIAYFREELEIGLVSSIQPMTSVYEMPVPFTLDITAAS